MCNAIYVAAILVALITALTVLRIKAPSSPNAEMLADALNRLDSPRSGHAPRTPKTSGTPPRPRAASNPALSS